MFRWSHGDVDGQLGLFVLLDDWNLEVCEFDFEFEPTEFEILRVYEEQKE